MRTFVIRARKGTTRWERVQSQIGAKAHFEVIAHCVINAFFVANGFRDNVEVYLILDSTEDFPRTLKLSSNDGLSLMGFHEKAVTELIEIALKTSSRLAKNAMQIVRPGVTLFGYGFERLLSEQLLERPIFLLAPKGTPVRTVHFPDNPVFILSDQLAMPKKTIQSLKRQGAHSISLGKRMLFASQCVVLVHYELDYSLPT